MTKKILCAVDDSEQSQHAVSLAAGMAKAMGSELTLLTVNPLMGGSGGKGAIAAYLWESDDLKRIVDGAIAAAKKAGVDSARSEVVKSRDVGRTIVLFAEDHGIDHIIVGSGGKSKLSRLMMGSVSHDVANRAHCPVTIAR